MSTVIRAPIYTAHFYVKRMLPIECVVAVLDLWHSDDRRRSEAPLSAEPGGAHLWSATAIPGHRLHLPHCPQSCRRWQAQLVWVYSVQLVSDLCMGGWNCLGQAIEVSRTLHNFVVLAIFLLKTIKVSENLTKLWQKQFWLLFWLFDCFFLRHGVYRTIQSTINLPKIDCHPLTVQNILYTSKTVR